MDGDDVLMTRHKLDVRDVEAMEAAGILGEDARVELIEGELIDMAPIGQDHAATVNGLTEALVLAFAGRAIVSVQNPVQLNRYNLPQPDFCVLRPRADKYRTGARPQPSDVLLLIEVADSSVRLDRTVKLPLYARAGVAEFWLVDLVQRVLDVYRDPGGGEYRSSQRYGVQDRVSLSLAPDVEVALATVFD